MPCAAPHVSHPRTSWKCFVMCTPAPAHTPHTPSQTHCSSVFQFRECHLGCSHAAEEQTRWNLFANMRPLSGLDSTWTSAFHQGRRAPTGGQNLTLSARLRLILYFPMSLLDSLVLGFPALCIPCSLPHLCVMHPEWIRWGRELPSHWAVGES